MNEDFMIIPDHVNNDGSDYGRGAGSGRASDDGSGHGHGYASGHGFDDGSGVGWGTEPDLGFGGSIMGWSKNSHSGFHHE